MSPPDDGALVEATRRGSSDAAAQLFERHWSPAWRAAYAITGNRVAADDAAQTGFERAFGALARFDVRRPFAPWLHRIVVNAALDGLRSEKRLVSAEVADLAQSAAGDSPAQADRLDLVDALRQIPPERRVPIVLRYLLGYTPAEIAGMVDAPVGTVSSRLARGLEQLRSILEVQDAQRL